MSTDLYVAPNKGLSHLDKNITTREKFGTQVKKCLAYFKDNKRKVFSLDIVIHQMIKISKDFKRSLDLICAFESLGLVTRISPERYIYTGFKGVSARLMEHQLSNRSLDSHFIPIFDEIVYQGKQISVKSNLIVGNFIAILFLDVIYLSGKLVNKNRVEQAVEEFASRHKDIGTKNLSQDFQNILIALNFIERNETTEILAYTGPQLCTYDQNYKKDLAKVQQLEKAEELYFCRDSGEPVRQEEEPRQLSQEAMVGMSLSHFHTLSYALLKSKNWEYPLKQLSTIIGRSNTDKKWTVDLELPYRSISRQHAVILYNFLAKKWEIRCLSKKNLIKVDGERFAFRDKDIFLRDKAVVEIGLETFLFCLPKPNS